MLVLAKIQFSSRFRLGPAFVRLQPGKEETFFSGVTVTYLCFFPFFFHVQSSKRPLKTMLKGVGKDQGKGKGKPEGKGKSSIEMYKMTVGQESTINLWSKMYSN